MNITELAKKLSELKIKKDKLEVELKTVNLEIQKVASNELPKAMEDQEIDKFSVDGIGTIYLRNDFFANVLASDRENLHNWLRETGNEDLIKDYIFPQTLKAFAKECLENGKSLPDFIKTTFVPTATIRRN